MSLAIALAAALALLVAALGFAYWVERRREALAGWLTHPLTYTLALGTYYTGWAYFGTGAALFTSGISYLSHEIGWSFLFLFGWPLILQAMRFARAHRVTTLPGFLAVRYGASPGLRALLVGILALAMVPYLSLQLQAIAFAFETVVTAHAAEPAEIGAVIPLWATLVAGFAILFGGRRPDLTRRLPGVFATLAVGSAVKLGVLLVVAAAAWWRFGPQMAAMPPSQWPEVHLGTSRETSYLVWLLNLAGSMASVLLLPHIFHLAIVEGRNERQVRTSRWAFPLYGWIFEVALLPVTLAGVLLGLKGMSLQGAVLLVPTWEPLRLAAFLGGVAAASGMAMITMIALANMLLQDGVLPLFRARIQQAARFVVPLRAGLIALLALAATGLWRFGQHTLFFEIGLIAFIALSQVAPAFFGGLVWPQLQGRAIAWGLGLASLVWLYTAMLPSLAPSVPLLAAWMQAGPAGIAFLRPQALFGVEGLPPSAHALFWCSIVNLAAIWVVMLRQPATPTEVRRARALLAGSAAPHLARPVTTTVDWPRLEQLMTSCLGPEAADVEIATLRAAFEAASGTPESRVLNARDAAENVLRGPLGYAAARQAVDQVMPISDQTLVGVMQAYRQLEQLLALSQEELADRIQELTKLKEELEARVEARTADLATERDRLQAALEDLRNLEKLKAAFVNAISHDLRIPLTGIMGYAEFLEEGLDGELNESQLADVCRILEAARRMRSLLNDLLEYARLESGAFTVDVRAMAFQGALEEAANTFFPAFERKRIRYEAYLPEPLPEVHADPERVVQVLSNLLSNAAKFTPDGGSIVVRGALLDGPPRLRVEVADTGVGIAPEDMPHLFERFYQTKAGRQAGGTGLGLNISKTLIEAQGGEMGATSELGRGSTFWFTLPLATDGLAAGEI